MYARGNDGASVFRDTADFRLYLTRLGEVVDQMRWWCLGYCLLDNHLHLLVETPDANLGSGMQRLHSHYAQAFNKRHQRIGHVFQGRYGATTMKSDAQVCAAGAYIARNPVAAGLCSQPGDWPWSSYRATIDGGAPQWLARGRLLAFYGNQDDVARWRYAEMSGEPGSFLKRGLTPLGAR